MHELPPRKFLCSSAMPNKVIKMCLPILSWAGWLVLWDYSILVCECGSKKSTRGFTLHYHLDSTFGRPSASRTIRYAGSVSALAHISNDSADRPTSVMSSSQQSSLVFFVHEFMWHEWRARLGWLGANTRRHEAYLFASVMATSLIKKKTTRKPFWHIKNVSSLHTFEYEDLSFRYFIYL